MAAVSNSSPLIFLSAIGRFELLRDIYDEILVPPAVWSETVAAGAGRVGASETVNAPWLRRVPPPPEMVAMLRPAELHAGETEAIALALSIDPGTPIILDDRRARRVAREAGLTVTGTGGVVALAKRLGFVSSFDDALSLLQQAGLYLSDFAVEELRDLAGESR